MKAKIRNTDEIVDVMSFKASEGCPERDWVCYVDSEGLEHTQKLNALRDLEVIEDIPDVSDIIDLKPPLSNSPLRIKDIYKLLIEVSNYHR